MHARQVEQRDSYRANDISAAVDRRISAMRLMAARFCASAAANNSRLLQEPVRLCGALGASMGIVTPTEEETEAQSNYS